MTPRQHGSTYVNRQSPGVTNMCFTEEGLAALLAFIYAEGQKDMQVVKLQNELDTAKRAEANTDRQLTHYYAELQRLVAERDELLAQVKFAMPYVLADARRTLNTYGCADITYAEAEKLAKYAKQALAATEPKGTP